MVSYHKSVTQICITSLFLFHLIENKSNKKLLLKTIFINEINSIYDLKSVVNKYTDYYKGAFCKYDFIESSLTFPRLTIAITKIDIPYDRTDEFSYAPSFYLPLIPSLQIYCNGGIRSMFFSEWTIHFFIPVGLGVFTILFSFLI